MALIAPNGELRLCSVPIDNTYRNQIDFTDSSAQAAYFAGKALHPFPAGGSPGYRFIEKDQNVRLPVNADTLYNVNYIMYRNTYFGTKWFYAFVLRIEYLSDSSCAVYFETDVWQTWHFDIQLKDSFILREHATTDFPGSNTVPEQLEIGDYNVSQFTSGGLSDLAFVVATNISSLTKVNDEWQKVIASGKTYSGIYSGSVLIAFDANDTSAISAMNTFLENITEAGYPDAIIAIYMCPKYFLQTTAGIGTVQAASYSSHNKTVSVTIPSTVGGYTPKNKKLLTYPYQMVYIHNNSGSAAVYKPEKFSTIVSNRQATFKIHGVILPNPSFKIFPDSSTYNAWDGAQYDEALTLAGFSFCSWSYDTYRAWLAQNGSSHSVATQGSVIGGVGQIAGGLLGLIGGAVATFGSAGSLTPVSGAAMLGGAGAIGSGINSIRMAMAKEEETQIQPPQAKGNVYSGSVNCGMEANDFFIGIKSIRSDFAKRIDDFFTMFGYATNEVKTPAIRTRPIFNYIHTSGVNITGGIPVGDMAKIKSMFDNGVTFWHNGNNVGNYQLNNQL